MAAAYDNFDYPTYWMTREYEHKSEVMVLNNFLHRINKIKNMIEIGAGFGRLVPYYSYRAKKIIVSDPSSKLLRVAREDFKDKRNLKFIHSSLENLPKKVRPKTMDLAIIVRVLHHIKDVPLGLKIIGKMLTPGGYLILEFPNKIHFKKTLSQFRKGDLTYPLDLTITDMRSKKAIKKGLLPFYNFHPDKICEMLEDAGFEVIEKRSVSNIRSSFLKKIFSVDLLLYAEKLTQVPLSYLNFGPSIFILARKR